MNTSRSMKFTCYFVITLMLFMTSVISILMNDDKFDMNTSEDLNLRDDVFYFHDFNECIANLSKKYNLENASKECYEQFRSAQKEITFLQVNLGDAVTPITTTSIMGHDGGTSNSVEFGSKVPETIEWWWDQDKKEEQGPTELGKGTFGTTFKVKDKASKLYYALKIIVPSENQNQDGLYKSVNRELQSFVNTMECPYVMKLKSMDSTSAFTVKMGEFPPKVVEIIDKQHSEQEETEKDIITGKTIYLKPWGNEETETGYYGKETKVFAFILELGNGGSLSNTIGVPSKADLLLTYRDLAQGLKCINDSAGMIHSDIKPDNVMMKFLDNCEGRCQGYIIDLGLAKPIDELKKSCEKVKYNSDAAIQGTKKYTPPLLRSDSEDSKVPEKDCEYSLYHWDEYSLGVSLEESADLYLNEQDKKALMKLVSELKNIPKTKDSRWDDTINKLSSLSASAVEKEFDNMPKTLQRYQERKHTLLRANSAPSLAGMLVGGTTTTTTKARSNSATNRRNIFSSAAVNKEYPHHGVNRNQYVELTPPREIDNESTSRSASKKSTDNSSNQY